MLFLIPDKEYNLNKLAIIQAPRKQELTKNLTKVSSARDILYLISQAVAAHYKLLMWSIVSQRKQKQSPKLHGVKKVQSTKKAVWRVNLVFQV